MSNPLADLDMSFRAPSYQETYEFLFTPSKLDSRCERYLDRYYPEHRGHGKKAQAVISLDMDFLCLCPDRPNKHLYGPKLHIPGAVIALWAKFPDWGDICP